MDRKIGGMTLREGLGIGLLIILLLMGLWSSWYLSRQHTAMASKLDSNSWLALSGQWENAKEGAVTVRQDWEKGWKFRTALANHSHLEEIDALFREMTVYSAAGERTEFARICGLLTEKLEALAASCRLSWWNVL